MPDTPDKLTPAYGNAPSVYLRLRSQSGADSGDIGRLCTYMTYTATINGGYIVECRLSDVGYALLDTIFKNGYLAMARSQICEVEFQMKQADTGEYPAQATMRQRAFVASLDAEGVGGKSGEFSFVAIDPPSWYLCAGDASGKVYRGKVSDVIRKVVTDYAPSIALELGDTNDAPTNRWWMNRMDPKAFIMSLLEWSSSITKNRTRWLVANDDERLIIKEQAAIQPRMTGLYYKNTSNISDTIADWRLLADNALTIVGTKMVTHGASVVTGRYFDRITDTAQLKLFAKDATTAAKYKPKVDAVRSFTKAPDGRPPGQPMSGWTSMPSVPEIYSAGDLGRAYDDYIDGIARSSYLNLAGMTMRAVFRVPGHGIYTNGLGLGADYIIVQWMDQTGEPYMMSGPWLVYGFSHNYRPRRWQTDVYVLRLDWDALAVPVP